MPKGVFRLVTCPECQKDVPANVFNRHVKSACGTASKYVKKGTLGKWSKGLTKSMDDRLRKMGEQVSKSLTGKPGHPLSDRHKRLLSVLQSERLLKGYADGSRDQFGGYCKWFEVDGVKVQGTWELRTAKILSEWKHSGRILDWSRCPYRIPYTIDGHHHTYTPDFVVKRLDGTEYILEVKGRQSIVDDVKWKAAGASFDFIVWRLKDIQDNERELNKP